jgi:hypothetical protein
LYTNSCQFKVELNCILFPYLFTTVLFTTITRDNFQLTATTYQTATATD